MAKQLAEVQIHAAEDDDLDECLDISVDQIDDGLFLGNLACARDYKTLEKLQISHILTIDVVPLPRTILDRTNLTFHYVKLADVPKEDLITHLPETNEFIKKAIADGGIVLVHCHFGVSRSAAVVIGYIMEKYGLCYEEAFTLVKSKRRFVGPNVGFVAQLKLFGHMGYTLNKDDPRFKQFRLKLAGQKLNQVKILPQLFADLVKPDPGLVRERPDPIVYRCKKCRCIVASQNNIIPHIPKSVKVELAKKGIRPPPSKLTGLNCTENGEILIEKLKSLASQLMDMRCGETNEESPGQSSTLQQHDDGPSQQFLFFSPTVEHMPPSIMSGFRHNHCSWQADWHMFLYWLYVPEENAAACSDDPLLASYNNHGKRWGGPILSRHLTATTVKHRLFLKMLDGYSETNMVDANIAARVDLPENCRLMWFVEPMTWMKNVSNQPSGKLHCPKCSNKIGSFSWIMGCKCPCGQKVAPAFYLVPSKVEWSNIVQNVQITV